MTEPQTAYRSSRLFITLTEAESTALHVVSKANGETKSGYMRRLLYERPQFREILTKTETKGEQ